jgi:hypothetical protein
MKRILLFIASEHDVHPQTANAIAELLQNETVYLDIVVIGTDVSNVDVLRSLCPTEIVASCVFLVVPHSQTVLSDDVLASGIGPGRQMARVEIPDFAKREPSVAKALHLAVQEGRQKSKQAGSLGPLLDDGTPGKRQKGVRGRRTAEGGEGRRDGGKKRK